MRRAILRRKLVKMAPPLPPCEHFQVPCLRRADGPDPGEADVTAPLLGNYYQAPRPGDPPFVEVGDRVSEDTVIGIIEVMKLMNSVRAGVAGTVVAHLVQNGTAVELGQPLIRVKTDD